MNLAETSDLLAYIARVDNRRVDDATAIAWQAILSDLPLVDCLTAARQHFATNDAYLMPVHIVRLANEIERQRRRFEQAMRERAEGLVRSPGSLERDPGLALPAVPAEDRSEEVRWLLAQLADKLGPSDPTVFRRPEWVEADRQRERAAAAEPNPHFTGLPPEGGHPLPGEDQRSSKESG